MINSNQIINNVEKQIEKVMRDDTFIKLVSFNLNTALKIQKYTHRKFETLLKIADVPTVKSLNELFETVHQLEKETHEQKEKIAHLETELADYKNQKLKKTKKTPKEDEKIVF